MRKNFLMNTPNIRRKIAFTATKSKKTEGIVKLLYVGSRHGHLWQSINTDMESGVRKHTFHLPLQTAAATEYAHRRYILMVVSILYQCTGCKRDWRTPSGKEAAGNSTIRYII